MTNMIVPTWSYLIKWFLLLNMLTDLQGQAVLNEEEKFKPCKLLPFHILQCEYLSWQTIPALDTRIKLDANKFIHLNIYKNNINFISNNTFIFDNNIVSIKITDNEVPKNSDFRIHSRAFINLKKLENLTIRNKFMANLGADTHLNQVLKQVPSLSELNLKHFQINTLIPQLPLNELKIIHLENVNIPQGFANDIFASTTSLETLELTSTDSAVFSNIENWGRPLINLRVLIIFPTTPISNIILPKFPNLNNLFIRNIDTGADLTQLNPATLSKLTLSGFRIKSLDTFQGIKKLYNIEVLTLISTGLTNIPPQLKSFKKLKHLSLIGNSIATIGKLSFESNIYLQELVIFNVNVHCVFLVDSFTPLQNLVKLNLKDIKKVNFGTQDDWSKVFEKLPALRDLTMQYLKLDASIWNQLIGLDKLINLDLSFNNIDSIPVDTFREFRSLKSLHLNNNKLVEIDATSFAGLNFHDLTLNLQNNMIKVLRNCSFGDSYIAGLNVNLGNNSLQCDCRILWLWLMYPDLLTTDLICDKDGPYGGRFLSSLSEARLRMPQCSIQMPDVCPADSTDAFPEGVVLILRDKDQRSVIASCGGCENNQELRKTFSTMQVTYIAVEAKGSTTPQLITQSLSTLEPSINILLQNPVLEHELCLSFKRVDGKGSTQAICKTYRNNLAFVDTQRQVADGGLSSGSIAAIVIGILLFLILLIMGIICCKKRRKEKEILKMRVEQGQRVASMHSLQFYDDNGMAVEHPEILQRPGSRHGLAVSSSNLALPPDVRSSLHSLYAAPHQIGGAEPTGGGSNWLGIADQTDQTTGRYRKNKSKSMEMLDAVGGAPSLRSPRQFRKSNAWQSSENILMDNRQSTASNRLPLSLSQAYLNAGLVPPSAPGPLPPPPGDSPYEELDDMHVYNQPQPLPSLFPNRPDDNRNPGGYLPMTESQRDENYMTMKSSENERLGNDEPLDNYAVSPTQLKKKPPTAKHTADCEPDENYMSMTPQEKQPLISNAQSIDKTPVNNYALPDNSHNEPSSYQPLIQSPPPPKVKPSLPSLKPIPPQKPSQSSSSHSSTPNSSHASANSLRQKPALPIKPKSPLPAKDTNPLGTNLPPPAPPKPKPVATVAPNIPIKPRLSAKPKLIPSPAPQKSNFSYDQLSNVENSDVQC